MSVKMTGTRVSAGHPLLPGTTGGSRYPGAGTGRVLGPKGSGGYGGNPMPRGSGKAPMPGTEIKSDPGGHIHIKSKIASAPSANVDTTQGKSSARVTRPHGGALKSAKNGSIGAIPKAG